MRDDLNDRVKGGWEGVGHFVNGTRLQREECWSHAVLFFESWHYRATFPHSSMRVQFHCSTKQQNLDRTRGSSPIELHRVLTRSEINHSLRLMCSKNKQIRTEQYQIPASRCPSQIMLIKHRCIRCARNCLPKLTCTEVESDIDVRAGWYCKTGGWRNRGLVAKPETHCDRSTGSVCKSLSNNIN